MHRTDKSKNIIEYPENYQEMVDKLKEREDEQLQRVLAKRKAETAEELKEIASKAIVKRMLRTSGDHKSLKDLTILREPKSEDVANLRERLNKEITELAKQVLTQLPAELSTLKGKLKGRIKPGGEEITSTD